MEGPTTSSARQTGDSLIDGFSPEELRELYRRLLLPRIIEEKMHVLLRQGRLSKWFSGIGQEAIATGVVAALEPSDYVLPMHRNLGVFTGRGLELPRLFRQLLGRSGSFTGGRDRTFHFGTLEHGIVGMISHLGAMLPVACGLALAAQLRGDKRVAAAFTGDGATSEGDFHEALNLAAVWKLPVIFVIENNQWGLSTPVHEQYACRHLADRGIGYGMPGYVVDGNDLPAVVRAVRRAADRGRRGDGPTLIEFKTYRMRGHEEASGIDYVPKQELEEWAKKDPVKRYESFLAEKGVLRRAISRASARRERPRSTRSWTRRSRPRSRSRAGSRSSATSTRRARPRVHPPRAKPRDRRRSAATSTRSATACASRCGATSASC
jgi:2-oxoisovalerate dehydrogenase E1 component